MRRSLTIGLAAVALVLVACGTDDADPSPPEPDPGEPTGPDPDAEPDPEPEPEPDPDADADEGEEPEVEEGAWEELPEAPIAARINHSVTWADGLLVVWGGEDQDELAVTDDGAVFDPDADEWREIEAAPIDGRWAHDAVWTGDEVIIWGGTGGADHLAPCFTDGARLDPVDGTWEPIPEAPGPARCGAATVWADDEFLVFGGYESNGPPGADARFDDGAAFDPETGEWRKIAAAPDGVRADAVAVWSGEEMLVHGGHESDEAEGFAYRTDGSAYDPQADSWRSIEDAPLPPATGRSAVWIDDAMLLFGGTDPDGEGTEPLADVAAYDPEADDWQTFSDQSWPHGTSEAVWTGDVVYVLGADPPPAEEEVDADEDSRIFQALVVDDDEWIERPDPPGGHRQHHSMDWTGAELLVWGGEAGDESAPGARWTPPAPVEEDEPAENDEEIELTVEPACVEVGDGFTAVATGLEPGEQYAVLIDPVPAPGMEPGTSGEADDEGRLEVPANVADTPETQTGTHTVTVGPSEAGEQTEQLAETSFETAESCP